MERFLSKIRCIWWSENAHGSRTAAHTHFYPSRFGLWKCGGSTSSI